MTQAKITPYTLDEGKETGGGKRGEVCGRSTAARWRFIQDLATHQKAFEPPAPAIFVTLTHALDYPDWEESKKLFERLRALITYHWGDLLMGYWVPEAQDRGASHYHALLRWMGDPRELDEVAGADRTPWTKEKAGRDDGKLGARWRDLTGDEGSDPRDRRRYAVAIEDVRGGPGMVSRATWSSGSIKSCRRQGSRGSVAEKGRVGDWRGNGRRMGVAVAGGFRNAGASLPAMAPFPVTAFR